jgi:hypothetical protein
MGLLWAKHSLLWGCSVNDENIFILHSSEGQNKLECLTPANFPDICELAMILPLGGSQYGALLAPKLAKDKCSTLSLLDKGFIILTKDKNVIFFLCNFGQKPTLAFHKFVRRMPNFAKDKCSYSRWKKFNVKYFFFVTSYVLCFQVNTAVYTSLTNIC